MQSQLPDVNTLAIHLRNFQHDLPIADTNDDLRAFGQADRCERRGEGQLDRLRCSTKHLHRDRPQLLRLYQADRFPFLALIDSEKQH